MTEAEFRAMLEGEVAAIPGARMTESASDGLYRREWRVSGPGELGHQTIYWDEDSGPGACYSTRFGGRTIVHRMAIDTPERLQAYFRKVGLIEGDAARAPRASQHAPVNAA